MWTSGSKRTESYRLISTLKGCVVASIQTRVKKDGKVSYFIVYSQRIRGNSKKKYHYKNKWLAAGDTKSEAEAALRSFKKTYTNNPSKFNTCSNFSLGEFLTQEFLPWSKTTKNRGAPTGIPRGLRVTCFDVFF